MSGWPPVDETRLPTHRLITDGVVRHEMDGGVFWPPISLSISIDMQALAFTPSSALMGISYQIFPASQQRLSELGW